MQHLVRRSPCDGALCFFKKYNCCGVLFSCLSTGAQGEGERAVAQKDGAGDHSAHLHNPLHAETFMWGAAELQRSRGFILGGWLSNHISNRNCCYSRHLEEALFSLPKVRISLDFAFLFTRLREKMSN